jgi:hypothetical protein
MTSGGSYIIISWLAQRQTLLTPLKIKLNPICHLLALLGVHPIIHVSRIRVKAQAGYAVLLPITISHDLPDIGKR